MSVSEAVGAEMVQRGDHPTTLVEAIASMRTSSGSTPGDSAPDDPAPGDPAAAIRDLDVAIADGSDELAAIAAVHALAAFPGVEAGERLAALVYQDGSFLRDHAAWALGSRSPVAAALPGLVDLVLDGGFAGTLAQATLESFAAQEPGLVRDALVAAVPYATLEDARGRLVETLGLVPGVVSTRILLELAADDDELPAARAAALAALGDVADPFDAQVLATLDAVAGSHGALAAVARLARSDLDRRRYPPVGRAVRQGLTVAQLFLHADIDGDLRRAGQGDTGGIATLLVHLGDALLADPGPVRRVLTISRGRAGDDPGLESVDLPGHHYLPVPFWGPSVPAAEAWPLRVATRRATRRILDRAQVDVLHLRMADVGSWAAAEAARDLGVPVVLTFAPDPHASVASREADGVLTRQNVGRVDEVEHLVFRILLLRQIQQQASQLVVFPRPALAANLRDLLGVDVERERGRVTVVPEGIDPVPLDRAAREVPAAAQGGYASAATLDALDDLDDLLITLPPDRRGLPLALTVGRLHPVKGMATLVQAWTGHPELAERCNLLVIGGDLRNPSPDEREQLSRIDAAVARTDGPRVGLLLAGHRPNATVATWLAAARFGRPDLCGPGGVYVSASLKEEFGIAILEAMASGLVVVAPWEGGPATYVEDGVTGVLADTRSPAALAAAVAAAFDRAAAPGARRRAAGAQRLVRERFSVHTMAAALAAIYQDVAS
ncbi:MAG TPA: glycosyltransferase [Lapillicoccus sp.]|uniref:glycosyltransferase n=1 Tax=Lapillicoccus sp. TaxID=1909287 RepID=UPI002F943BB1